MPAVTLVAPSSDTDVNGLLTGYKWATTSLTYSFPDDASFYGSTYSFGVGENTVGFAPLNAAQRAAVVSILNQFSAVSSLEFMLVTETADQHGDLRQAQSALPYSAQSYYPHPASANNESGDSWFGTSRNWYGDPVAGSYAYFTFLHELGLALGLRDDITGTALSASHASMEYTVETYRSYVGASVNRGYYNETWGYAQTLMMYDIAAIQHMYGANYETNSGDTVYTWDSTTGQQLINGVGQEMPGGNRIFATVWDGGGVDTYDLSNYTTNLKIDLQPGAWNTFSTAQLADLGYDRGAGRHMAAGNIANALLHGNDTRSLIDNAIGGTGNDTITGNQIDNALTGGNGNDTLNGLAGNDTLDGGAGDDRLAGGAGNDTLIGGSGTDTVVFAGTKSQYQITRLADNQVQIKDMRGGSPDGTDQISNAEFFQFSDGTFSLQQLGLVGPQLTALDTNAVKKQTITASSLLSSTDITIVQYQFWELTSNARSGHFSLDGVALPANQIVDVMPGQLPQLDFITGAASDVVAVRAFDGLVWSEWKLSRINVPVNQAPVIAAQDVAAGRGQQIAAANLFSVVDHDGDSITAYQVADGNAAAQSGHFTLNGVAQAANTVINVAADQLASLTFDTTCGTDVIALRAFDGYDWGSWRVLYVNAPVNRTPVLSSGDASFAANQRLAASSLFTVSDPDNDAIVKYQFADGSGDAMSGYFDLNGVRQAANQIIDVSAAELASMTYKMGKASEVLAVRGWDGYAWSDWFVIRVNGPVNHAPVVTASDIAAAHGQRLDGSELFQTSDSDGDPLVKYEFIDATNAVGSGYFMVDGVVQPSNYVITVAADQLSKVKFQSGSGADAISVRVFDGIDWSGWKTLHVDAPVDLAPVVQASDVVASHGERFAASDLLAVTDAEGDAIVKFQFADGNAAPTSGHFELNGSELAANQVIDISAEQLDHFAFQTGSGSDVIAVRAFDGILWSNWKVLTIDAPVNRAPVVVAADMTAARGTSLDLSDIFNVTDAENDAITKYQVADGNAKADSGYFALDGVAQQANQIIELTAAQLANATFEARSGSDIVAVRAYDGMVWGDWKVFTISAPVNRAPSITTANPSLAVNSETGLASLFTVSDADGDVISKFQFADGNARATSGYFEIDGVAQSANQVIEVLASDLDHASFVAGSEPGSDVLAVRAFDGATWSAWHVFSAASHA